MQSGGILVLRLGHVHHLHGDLVVDETCRCVGDVTRYGAGRLLRGHPVTVHVIHDIGIERYVGTDPTRGGLHVLHSGHVAGIPPRSSQILSDRGSHRATQLIDIHARLVVLVVTQHLLLKVRGQGRRWGQVSHRLILYHLV